MSPASSISHRPVPAVFIGIQDGFGITPSFELYNLTAQVGAHPAGSTVARKVLEEHGYVVPVNQRRRAA
jgi:hypothetical protein